MSRYCNWKSISPLWWENKLGTHLSRSVLSIWLRPFSHMPGMQDLWIISFFYFFPWSFTSKSKRKDGFQFLQKSLDGLGLEGLKVPKVSFLGFWQKFYPFRYAFLLQHEVLMFFYFCQCLQKSGSWVMVQKPQNAGFFKTQYLTKNLSYKVEFLESTKY